MSGWQDLLTRLGVAQPDTVMERYPHQLSGGLLQRAAIATALSCGPELVIADEPTTALDALVQVQVIESFRRLVRELGTSLLVITHDLRLLERTADRIAAMYAGRIVEFGPSRRLLAVPRHPYPAALLASSVLAAEPGQRLPTIDGQPPALPGTFAPCAFAPRCPRADERCSDGDAGVPLAGSRGRGLPPPPRLGCGRPLQQRPRRQRDRPGARPTAHGGAAALGPAHRHRPARPAGHRRPPRTARLVGRPDLRVHRRPQPARRAARLSAPPAIPWAPTPRVATCWRASSWVAD